MAHYNMSCGGDCAIANDAHMFIATLKAAVSGLAAELVGRLDLDEINLQWRSSADPSVFSPVGGWVGWQLLFNQPIFRCDDSADGLYLGRVVPHVSRRRIVSEMKILLAERFRLSQTKRFNSTALLLLNVAIELKDTITLNKALGSLTCEIPKCTKIYLIERSIELLFHPGVKALLKQGSKVSVPTGQVSQHHPVLTCLKQFSEAVKTPGMDTYSLLNIWSDLLSSCDSTCLIESEYCGAFYRLGDIALIDAAASETLIEMASGYLKDFNSNDDEEKDSPSAPWSLVKNLSKYQLHQRGKIIAFGLLPLLRAGSRFSFSDAGLFKKAFFNAFNQISAYREINSYIFGRDQRLLHVVSEFLPTKVWCNIPDCYGNVPRFGNPQPRRLKSLARRALLESLPFGLSKRMMIIRQLRIPYTLQDYLNYLELEPLPNSIAAADGASAH